jgi:hypothetical protein
MSGKTEANSGMPMRTAPPRIPNGSVTNLQKSNV